MSSLRNSLRAQPTWSRGSCPWDCFWTAKIFGSERITIFNFIYFGVYYFENSSLQSTRWQIPKNYPRKNFPLAALNLKRILSATDFEIWVFPLYSRYCNTGTKQSEFMKKILAARNLIDEHQSGFCDAVAVAVALYRNMITKTHEVCSKSDFSQIHYIRLYLDIRLRLKPVDRLSRLRLYNQILMKH